MTRRKRQSVLRWIPEGLDKTVNMISDKTDRSKQDVLREINKRLQPKRRRNLKLKGYDFKV